MHRLQAIGSWGLLLLGLVGLALLIVDVLSPSISVFDRQLSFSLLLSGWTLSGLSGVAQLKRQVAAVLSILGAVVAVAGLLLLFTGR